jgi:tRNA G18 (ribose-2'-O)-methylase SpoU
MVSRVRSVRQDSQESLSAQQRHDMQLALTSHALTTALTISNNLQQLLVQQEKYVTRLEEILHRVRATSKEREVVCLIDEVLPR